MHLHIGRECFFQLIGFIFFFFKFSTYVLVRLDALALSVIATATWLGSWVAGWLSGTAGIVSKRLNLSENFLERKERKGSGFI